MFNFDVTKDSITKKKNNNRKKNTKAINFLPKISTEKGQEIYL